MTNNNKTEMTTEFTQNSLDTILQAPINLGLTESALQSLQTKFATIPDCTDKTGYELNRVSISELSKVRVNIKKRRDELKKKLNTKKSELVSFAEKMINGIEELEKPRREAKEKIDLEKKVEKERIEKEAAEKLQKMRDAITAIEKMATMEEFHPTSQQIKDQMGMVECVEIDDDFFDNNRELIDEAKYQKVMTIKALKICLQHTVAKEEQEEKDRIERELVEAEKKKLQEEREQFEKERREHEERLRKEAVEKRRKEEEEKKAEQRKIKYEIDKKRAAEEKEAREKAEAEQLAIDEQIQAEKVLREQESEQEEKNRIARTKQYVYDDLKDIESFLAALLDHHSESPTAVKSTKIAKLLMQGKFPHMEYINKESLKVFRQDKQYP